MATTFRIHLCSSNRDLASERHAVLQWLEDCKQRTEGFSFFGSRTLPALETALEDIAKADLVILLVGHLYGVMAPGLARSHEEREYEEAIRLGKKVWVALRSEESGRVPGQIEKDPQKIPLIIDFRKRLQENNHGQLFRDSTQLIQQLQSEVIDQLSGVGLTRRPVTRHSPRSRNTFSESNPLVNSAETTAGENSTSIENEPLTRTLPILQKALSTPFEVSRRSTQTRRMGLLIGTVLALGLVGVGIWRGHWLKKQPESTANLVSPVSENRNTDTLNADSTGHALKTDSLKADTLLTEKKPDPLTELLTLAKDGDTTALLRVGTLYDSGITLPQNDSLATSQYRKAAQQGMAEAQYRMGIRQMEGKGAKRSKAQALSWLQASAGQGYAPAESRLGRMYFKGLGVPRDEVQGLKWLLKAADQNEPEAEKIIAEIKEN